MSVGTATDARNRVADVFRDLGIRVATSWSRARYHLDALPEVAATELDRHPLHQDLDYASLLQWVSSTDVFPPQPNIASDFGDPPLTLFWHPHFYIEALFWCSSTTSIHGHGFSGAFQVLAGSSVQSLYAFLVDNPHAPRCRLGKLRQLSARLLHPGCTQQIVGGEGLIHSVFHLGYPSVTIVIRTFADNGQTQYNYHRPGVALPTGLVFDQLTRRLLQVAKLQAVLRSPDFCVTVARIAATCDLAAAYTLLREVTRVLQQQRRSEEVAKLILALAQAHGLPSISRLAEAVANDDLLRPLRQARDEIKEEDLRLFMALLLTQQGRSFLMSQVAEYTGEPEPADRVAGWICDLATRGVLKVPTDEGSRSLFSRWLREGRPTAAPSSTDARTHHEIVRIVQQVRAEPLLGPLFSDVE